MQHSITLPQHSHTTPKPLTFLAILYNEPSLHNFMSFLLPLIKCSQISIGIILSVLDFIRCLFSTVGHQSKRNVVLSGVPIFETSYPLYATGPSFLHRFLWVHATQNKQTNKKSSHQLFYRLSSNFGMNTYVNFYLDQFSTNTSLSVLYDQTITDYYASFIIISNFHG